MSKILATAILDPVRDPNTVEAETTTAIQAHREGRHITGKGMRIILGLAALMKKVFGLTGIPRRRALKEVQQGPDTGLTRGVLMNFYARMIEDIEKGVTDL